MEQPVFRQKSMEQITSPEQLSDYLHVSTPSVWVALAAVIILLVCLFVWSSQSAVESFAAGTAVAKDGVLSVSFNDQEKACHIKAGMEVKVGALKTTILSVGADEDGDLLAVAQLPIPDGTYDARVGYDRIQIINLLFN